MKGSTELAKSDVRLHSTTPNFSAELRQDKVALKISHL